MQYPIHITRWWQPWLLLVGVTPKSAFAELDKKVLRLRFGLAKYEVELGDIEGVGTYDWPSWAGVGWLPNLAGSVALIGSAGKAVEIRLRERKRLGALGIPCARLLVSVDNPDQFAEMLSQLLTKAKRTAAATAKKAPGGHVKTKPASKSRSSSSGGRRSKAA